MKSLFQKCIALILLSLPTLMLQAQTEKGRLYVGSNFSNLHAGIGRHSTQIGMKADPSFGKFIADNWLVGARLGLSFSLQRDGLQNFRSAGFSVSAGAFSRYYFSLSERIKPFVELETGVGQGFATFNGTTFDPRWAYFQASGGTAIMIGDKASLDLSLGFRGTTGLDRNTLGNFAGALQGKVGFSLYLPSRNQKLE